MPLTTDRRKFIESLGVSSALAPFLFNLQSLQAGNLSNRPKQRLVIVFSPNGVIPWEFWPDEAGSDFQLKRIMEPLAPYRDRMLMLNGVCDKIRGDGDSHMRGIGCLLTGVELFPGNIQGGSDTPAGWASGKSIDQEIANFLQSSPETATRFGSLEFGVVVPDRADTWTRMVYAGPNKPIAPIDDPRQMFEKLYGDRKSQALVASVLDDIHDEFNKLTTVVSAEDRRLLEEHASLVRSMEQELLEVSADTGRDHPVPDLDLSVRESNDNLPKISKLQIDLMLSSFVADFTRISTLQFTNSVGQARMRWLDIEESHHELSHEPDDNADAVEKLIKINQWYCEQLAYLVQRLDETPEPNGDGSMLDNTTVIWTNELGKGNSHTLDNIPFVLVGGGLGFNMGRSLQFDRISHNRLLLSLAHGFGHHIETFGNPDFCDGGPLGELTSAS